MGFVGILTCHFYLMLIRKALQHLPLYLFQETLENYAYLNQYICIYIQKPYTNLSFQADTSLASVGIDIKESPCF